MSRTFGLRTVMAIAAAALVVSAPTVRAQDFKKQVIYQIVTDRFFNGSSPNDNPSQSPGLYDSGEANWQAYWGGDLAGIQAKMSYLKGMGVTSIWISPVVDNTNQSMSSSGVSAPYHGYDARDFMKVEEHFGDTSNGWTAFDNLISSAHSNGIKVVLDWANNHSNYNGAGEAGALYNNGTFMGSASNDPNGIFHHNADINDYNDRYQLQYYTLVGLTDLNQENPTVDSYLKTAARQFQSHGVDGFRLDAIKHVTWGWEYSFANALYTNKPSFLYGEWITGTGDALYHDAYKFANKSGISELDFAVNNAARDVFANNNGFSELENAIEQENSNFTWNTDLVTFFDSHDENRILSINNNQNRVNEAMAFVLTCRGIPVILYGDEQYLHNDTNSGNDPYNRVQMTSFSTTTTAYKLISKLAGLRQSNDALAYGGWQQRYVANDVYIYERKFFDDVVLIAINKNNTTAQAITGLNTSLPAGTYSDFLGGLMSGQTLKVTAGSNGNNPAGALTLPANSVSVWQVASAATVPEVGSIGPTVGQAGMVVTIAGDGFGSSKGSVKLGGQVASINSWSNTSVTFTVPTGVTGLTTAVLSNASGTAANAIQFTALTAKLIPVTFTVNNATPTSPGDYIFLTGSTPELGNWGTSFDTAVGPMLDPSYPNWFLNAGMPAGTQIQFKFVKIAANGTVTYEGGSNHTYTVPSSGTGSVNVTWQN